jgi:acyl-CoA reductase-like NAD-dependent aldehyde dehydrogenase
MEKYQHYINGKWTDGSSKETINVVNPANGKDIGQVVCAKSDDVMQLLTQHLKLI